MDSAHKLVEEVQLHPALFDKENLHYCNRAYLNTQWNEIGEKLNMEGQAARKKWTTLRDYFTRAHKQMSLSNCGLAREKKHKWYLYDHMLFLLPYVSCNKTISNLSDVSDQEDELSLASVSSLPTASPFPGGVVTEMKIETEGPSLLGNRKRKRSTFPQEISQASTIDNEILAAINRISNTSHHKETYDEDEYFLKSLIPKMKTLDTPTKWELQLEMQTLVLRYVKNSRHQVKISSHEDTKL